MRNNPAPAHKQIDTINRNHCCVSRPVPVPSSIYTFSTAIAYDYISVHTSRVDGMIIVSFADSSPDGWLVGWLVLAHNNIICGVHL